MMVPGYSKEEVIGRHFRNFVAPEYEKAVERFYGIQVVKRIPWTYYEFPVSTKHGKTVWNGLTAQLLVKVGSLEEFQVIGSKIAGCRQADEALESERKKFQLLAESAPFGIVLIAEDGSFKYVNRKFEELFGYGLEDVPNSREWFRKAYANSEYRHEVISGWLEDLRNCPTGKARSRVVSVTCKNESQKTVHHRLIRLDDGDRLMTLEDITDLKRSEEQVRASREEKQMMLHEIRQRVKTNLAVVSSLLRLQSRYATDEVHRRMFRECETRVTSMVLAHELVYESESLSEVKVKDYVVNLLHHLLGAAKAERSGIDLETEIDDVVLGLEKVIPLGLIISELVSNSLEHAFREKRKGKIRLSLRSFGDRDLELVVQDDGVGMPEEIDLQGCKSIGLKLVHILATQLGGETQMVTGKGTQVSMRFGAGESNL
jgi:PAS domain S-box-containing protein